MSVFHLFPNIKKKIRKVSKRYDSLALSIFEAKAPSYMAGVLIIVLLVLFEANSYFSSADKRLATNSSPITLEKNALFPQLNAVLGSSTDQPVTYPEISALGAVVMDDDSKTIIYAKNPNLRFSMASTTKIMTALTAFSYYKDDDVLTVMSGTVGSLVGFKIGEQATFSNMLYGMLLPSGNDAALAIAQNFPGGLDAFVEQMNNNADKYHLSNTHFADSAGLEDALDYTTPLDLARLASVAIKNQKIAEIVSTKEKIITDVSGKNVYKLENLNKLLGEDGVNGIKTGFTDEAGGVLVTSKIEQGHLLIIVVMKSVDRFADTQQLLNLVNGKIKYLDINPN